MGFCQCPFGVKCLKEGGVSTMSWLWWGYFGGGGGLVLFKCVGGMEELYQCLYAFFGAEDV